MNTSTLNTKPQNLDSPDPTETHLKFCKEAVILLPVNKARDRSRSVGSIFTMIATDHNLTLQIQIKKFLRRNETFFPLLILTQLSEKVKVEA